jgi:hypothetical protein
MTTVYTQTSEELTQFANQVKDVLMDVTGHNDLEDYVVTIGKGSTFRRFAQKWLGYDPKDNADDNLKIVVTKAVVTSAQD